MKTTNPAPQASQISSLPLLNAAAMAVHFQVRSECCSVFTALEEIATRKALSIEQLATQLCKLCPEYRNLLKNSRFGKGLK